MKEALSFLGQLTHQLQKERGCISLLVGSNGARFLDETKAQFKQTDKTLNKLFDFNNKWRDKNILHPAIIDKIDIVINKLGKLPNRRRKITAQSMNTTESIYYYTYEIIFPLLDVMNDIVLSDDDNNSSKVSVYTNFLSWKERTSREGAIGMRGFISHNFNNKEFIERIRFLISEQESYQNSFMMLANNKQKACFDEIMKRPSVMRLDKIHKSFENAGNSTQLNHMSAEAWYDLLTHKIDMMHQLEDTLIMTLQDFDHTDEDDKTSNPEHVDASIEMSKQYRSVIKKLPLFYGIDDETINTLLQSSQTREYSKGKVLFLEGEEPSRLYIILNGWVKIFKGTESGEEATLQMLGAGNNIIESAIFLNNHFHVSAQIIEDATLISFPAPVIREMIHSNNQLAVNMINILSERSQVMFHQIESTRLKTAKERLGWYLLQLQLNNGGLSNVVELPYDKSIIASYLDMKPETLSRTFKSLKQDGFKINNDTITLPEDKSLCKYCDSDILTKCPQNGNSTCEYDECGNVISSADKSDRSVA